MVFLSFPMIFPHFPRIFPKQKRLRSRSASDAGCDGGGDLKNKARWWGENGELMGVNPWKFAAVEGFMVLMI